MISHDLCISLPDKANNDDVVLLSMKCKGDRATEKHGVTYFPLQFPLPWQLPFGTFLPLLYIDINT